MGKRFTALAIAWTALLHIALKTGSVEEVWKDGNPACGCSSRLLRFCRLSLCGSVSVLGLGNNLGTLVHDRPTYYGEVHG